MVESQRWSNQYRLNHRITVTPLNPGFQHLGLSGETEIRKPGFCVPRYWYSWDKKGWKSADKNIWF
jgi:hypothetical protein